MLFSTKEKCLKKLQKIKLLYGRILQSCSTNFLSVSSLNKKKNILKIWGDSVKKLKEKSEKTLKKRIFCMKALRNHQFRTTKFIG
jgi:hypothetical protein